MSGILSEIGSILFKQQRSIAGIIPDVTVREQAQDELEITQHPVAVGYVVTDHAFKHPCVLQLEYGWTNSSLSTVSAQSLLSGTLPSLSLGNQRVRQIYEQLLALQASRQPFQVVTGKRLYQNMLLKSLGITTDATTENALAVTATCQEIIITTTSTVSVVPAPIAQQANPASTAGVTDVGTVQPVQVAPGSILRLGSNYLGFTSP